MIICFLLNELGVPHGSILAPLLFVIYITNIIKVIKDYKIRLFTGDALIYITGKDNKSILNKINGDINNISKWLKTQNMKNKVHYHGNRIYDESYKVLIGCENLEKVNRLKCY